MTARTNTIAVHTEVLPLVVKAPQLRPLARLLFRHRSHPEDRRAYIQLELMRNHGLDRCPGCEAHLSLQGYARTRTAFSERETMTCGGCSTTFVLFERMCA
jgi:hypothetical protein